MSGTVLVWVVCAVILGAVLGALALYTVAFSFKKKGEAEAVQEREELKAHFGALSAQALTAATEQFLKLAESRLETQQVRSKAELDERRQAVETAVGSLAERLKTYEQLIRAFESDRDKKYGSLEEQLRKAVSTTDKLQGATDSLRALLSNPGARGQWGERMADDILRAAGMQENLQYAKNRTQDTLATRPDFTFFLPQGHKFHMDVKFPLDNYMRMMNASTPEDKQRFKTEFLRDARSRIKEIQKREYINPDEGTLDYVLLFIPNEQVYSYLQESSPGLLDESLSQKVVLCSPFTLYAVLSVIRQAFDNFHFAQATQDVVKAIAGFDQAWQKFKERFAKLGEQLTRTQDVYADITGASYKKLDQAVARIDRLREGRGSEPVLPLPEETSEPSVLPPQ